MDEWPKPERKPFSPEIEARIDALLNKMTLPEKIGQMTHGEISWVSPSDVQEYALGSVLNEAGSRPGYVYGSLSDWVDRADSYWLASQQTTHKIPIMWGTDAVHGHNSVKGMTLFPHNIGLGASGDAQLVANIGRATASQVRATGLDWTFAPTVAVVQNTRWGRSYESYGQDPELVYHLSKAMVSGLQDNLSTDGILATAKHFIGDGAVKNGNDQGAAYITEDELINMQAMGYYAALEADVQIVMASFSSWWLTKLHADHYLLSEVLKNKMGFDGFIISDYNAIRQIAGCSIASCPAAINAGVDMLMVPKNWKPFIENTVGQVEHGEIALSRINDAVRRILRVKMRAGLFEQVQPSLREHSGNSELMSSPEIKALARQAVRQSLVMLKNSDQLLPLSKSKKYLVINGDNISRQAGGWSIDWQGYSLEEMFYPAGETILSGIKSLVKPEGGQVFTSYNFAMQNDVSAA
ncbi:MAG: beta-glucosidase [Psychromonas sp.]|jgi:beta-glucosidase|uniref:glycoside hydrolase family 3 protein n=1 Tax=Psychromonas sp. TaxID=1884585 RepID=UPI0039E281BB